MTEPTRRTFLRTTAIAGGIALAGCSGDDGGDGGDGNTVDMNDDLAFVPEDIEVSAGTTVVWENVGSLGHTVTAYEDEIPDDAEYFASGGFDSETAARDAYREEQAGNVTEGGTYEHTFEVEGTYEYFCIPHEMNGMVGTVTVV